MNIDMPHPKWVELGLIACRACPTKVGCQKCQFRDLTHAYRGCPDFRFMADHIRALMDAVKKDTYENATKNIPHLKRILARAAKVPMFEPSIEDEEMCSYCLESNEGGGPIDHKFWCVLKQAIDSLGITDEDGMIS